MTPALDYSRIAHLYDAFVDFDQDVPFFLEECRECGGRVLELMSGTGRVSVPLLEAGVDLTCVDSSAEMLGILRHKLDRRGLTAEIVEQDVTRLDLSHSYDLAVIPFHSFEELVTLTDQRAALRSIHRVLSSGGRLVCTLHNPLVRLRDMREGPTTVARGKIGDDRLTLEMDVTYDPGSKIVRGTETVVRRDSAKRIVSKDSLSIRYAVIEESAFRRLVGNSGFVVDEVFGDYDRSPFDPNGSPFMIWVLRRY